MHMRTLALLIATAGFCLTGCRDGDAAEMGDDAGCEGAKCDDPGGDTTGGSAETFASDTEGDTDGDTEGDTDSGRGSDTDSGNAGECVFVEVDPDAVIDACGDRADTAFNPNRVAFGEDAMRWSCADVDGRHPDDRGQEYCEYFAIVDLPDAELPGIYGVVDPQGGPTQAQIPLTEADMGRLEADPGAVVGSCVFTSWNEDVDVTTGDDFEELHRVAVTKHAFRMKLPQNSLQAAAFLVQDCVQCPRIGGDPQDAADPLHDTFTRGCYLNAEINETEDRKSDSVLCAAAMRMSECGCDVTSEDTYLENEIAAGDGLGFPLGTWDDPDGLPPGCRYQSVEGYAHNVVACDLTAGDVVQHAQEIKSFCADRYADDVVVYVPLPVEDIACAPVGDEYVESCGDSPWVIQPQ